MSDPGQPGAADERRIRNMYRVYYTWRNRGGTTHVDARTMEGAKALMNAKFQNFKNLLAAAIENMDTNERFEFYGPCGEEDD